MWPYGRIEAGLGDTVKIPRSGHTATALRDGRVLIVGGRSAGSLDASEAFDAQAVILFKPSFDSKEGVFTVLTDALSTARWDHSATLLPDGRIVIIGGRNESGELSSAEIFDPATEKFSPIPGVMNEPRAEHTATLLPNGEVLILGGREGADYLDSAESFDPASGNFSAASQGLISPRANHTAVLLYFGEILVTGGENTSGVLDSSEFYGPPMDDSVSPTVTQAAPANGSIDLDLTEVIGVRFSEPVDVTTLNSGSISLTGSGSIDTIISPSEQGLLVYLVPKFALLPGTTYTLSLTSAITDTAGNALAPFSSQFTTVAAPVITDVIPGSGSAGLGVTILGQNFDPDAPTLNVVEFNGVEGVVATATATQIETSVPFDAPLGAGTVTVTTRGGAASVPFTVENPVPVLVSLSPDSAVAGSGAFTLTLTGSNFINSSTVDFGGTVLIPSLIDATQLQATVPAEAIATPRTVQVSVTNPPPGGGTSAVVTFTVIGPVITGLSPDSGPVGTAVTITGLNFDPVAGNNQVAFNGTSAIISSATTTTIQTVVPQEATTGTVTVATPQGTADSPQPFTVEASTEFALLVEPQTISVVQEGFGFFVIRLQITGPGAPLVSLSVSSLPGGVETEFLPSVVTGTKESFLAINASATAALGTFPLTLTGTATIDGEVISRQTAVTLTVAPRPQTALSGLILGTEEHPIPNVTLTVGSLTTMTDSSGRFFFSEPPTGDQLLTIDGGTATTSTASYPLIWTKVTIQPGLINLVDHIIYLHEQKNYNFVDISNSLVERVVTDPEIPGFEMRIPEGVQIIGWDGLPNEKVSVKQLPIDKLPVRPIDRAMVARSVYMFYFGKQGGGIPDQPIPVTLPNDVDLAPGEKGELWYFDEDPSLEGATFDWKLAGTVTASEDGLTAATDPGVGIPRFCCGAVCIVRRGQGGGGGHGGGGGGGEPVYLNDGLFHFTKTDLLIPGRIPMAIRRVYNPLEVNGFVGPQTLLDYDIILRPTSSEALDLLIPGETRFTFSEEPDGTYAHPNHPRWNGAVIRPVGDTFELIHKDGTLWSFERFVPQAGAFHSLSGIADRNGNSLILSRDSLSRLTKVTDSTARSLDLSYSDLTRLGSVTDFLGRTMTYAYDSTGRLSTVTDPVGGTTVYEYESSSGRITSITDARGIKFLQNFHSGSGRVLRQVLADGGEYRFAYDVIGLSSSSGPDCRPLPLLSYTSTVADLPGFNLGATAADYYLRLVSESDGDIACPDFESWDLFEAGYRLLGGTILSTHVTDPNGNVTDHDFNNFGYPATIRDALGRITVFERESVTNRQVSTTDSLGRTTRFEYDDAGNTTSMTDAGGNVTTFEYDPIFNRVTQITDALGQVTQFTYDADGNLLATTDPLGNATTLTYNSFGQPVTVTDPLGNVTQFEYDETGNLTATIDALGNRTTRTYDDVSRLIGLTGPLGRSTSYFYDDLNRVVSIIDTNGSLTGFSYDANGNLLTVTDANGNTTTYTYDVQDRLETRTDPLGSVESYVYDLNGNLTQFTDRKSQVSSFGYDELNRRIRAGYGDGSVTTFTYDPVARLTQINDNTSGLIQMDYDRLDRLIQELTPQGVINYAYDAIGRRTTMTANGLASVSYSYDSASRLTQVAQGNNAVNLGYDASGRRTSLSYPNGANTSYSYDNASRVTQILHDGPSSVIENIFYTYDAAGNRISFDRLGPQAALPQPIQAAHNAANQLTQFNTDTLSYDNNGNLTSDGTTTYTWDARNRLVRMENTGSLAEFTYDALGRRIEKSLTTLNSQLTTSYLYDGNDIVAEIENGAISATYLRSLNIDEPFLRSTEVAEFYHTDALGSTLNLTDETGSTQTTYSYDPFGNTTITGTSTNPFQYTGRENDGTGMYYYRARYYSSTFQRFISEDPLLGGFIPSPRSPLLWVVPRLITQPSMLNPYAYVRNNPIRAIDPLGLKPCEGCIDQWLTCWNAAITVGTGCFGICAVVCLIGPVACAACVTTCVAGPAAMLYVCNKNFDRCMSKCDPCPKPPPPPCPGGRKGCAGGGGGSGGGDGSSGL